MPASLPVNASPKNPGPVPGASDAVAGPATESGSFADAMQAQEAPAGAAESTTVARNAPESTPPADKRVATEEAGKGASDAEDDAILNPARVDAMLGLCDGAPVTASAGSAEPATPLGGAPPEVGSCAPVAGIVVPPLPVVATPAPAQPVPEGVDRGLEAAFGSLSGVRASAAATAATSESLMARLEATLADADEAGSTRDAGPGANPALLDPRAVPTARVAEPQAAAARAPELRAPLGTPAWTDDLGSRVTWMLEQGEQVASLRLSPENLGPLDVRIAVREGETTVWFGAVHPETRAALEQSLPRLREMLGASGLALANAGVFSQTPRDPQRGFTAAALARAAVEGGADPALAGVNSVTHRGLVDLYA